MPGFIALLAYTLTATAATGQLLHEQTIHYLTLRFNGN
jgi:hypothetical protein